MSESQRHEPRFKNIAGCNFEIRSPDGSVEVIRPGQIVVGKQYFEFINAKNMGPLRWINKPKPEDFEIVIDTSLIGGR